MYKKQAKSKHFKDVRTMSIELKILQPSDIRNDLIVFFKNKSLIPIVGSGVSCDAPAKSGLLSAHLTKQESTFC